MGEPTWHPDTYVGPERQALLEQASPAPPWATGPIPDTDLYVESELFVAGAISTQPPFNTYHPAWALPIARQALDALGEWEPL